MRVALLIIQFDELVAPSSLYPDPRRLDWIYLGGAVINELDRTAALLNALLHLISPVRLEFVHQDHFIVKARSQIKFPFKYSKSSIIDDGN